MITYMNITDIVINLTLITHNLTSCYILQRNTATCINILLIMFYQLDNGTRS